MFAPPMKDLSPRAAQHHHAQLGIVSDCLHRVGERQPAFHRKCIAARLVRYRHIGDVSGLAPLDAYCEQIRLRQTQSAAAVC